MRTIAQLIRDGLEMEGHDATSLGLSKDRKAMTVMFQSRDEAQRFADDYGGNVSDVPDLDEPEHNRFAVSVAL
jgi:hypothetical protein